MKVYFLHSFKRGGKNNLIGCEILLTSSFFYPMQKKKIPIGSGRDYQIDRGRIQNVRRKAGEKKTQTNCDGRSII